MLQIHLFLPHRHPVTPPVSPFSPLSPPILRRFSLLLVDIQRRTVWEGRRIGSVQSLQIHLPHTYAELHGHQSPQELTARTRMQRRRRQHVQPVHLLLVDDSVEAHFPDDVVRSLAPKPRLQHSPDAEPLVLHPEHLPRALQL
ncbi:MAG: hypothetical protein IKJ81_03935 [Bacteroidales bacterium]|nr:hypothetical protein [Bacteroidales bacterium]